MRNLLKKCYWKCLLKPLDHLSFCFWNRWFWEISGLILSVWGLWEKKHTSVISETTAQLLTPRCCCSCLDLVISAQWLLSLSPTGKRSLEMIKWAFPCRRMHSHCMYWMAFIKCRCSNRYLCDCSVITDNEKHRGNLVSSYRRKEQHLSDCREKESAVNIVTWKCFHVARDGKIEEGGVMKKRSKSKRSKFGSWALVYVTSDPEHFWEPTPSQVWITGCCVCLSVFVTRLCVSNAFSPCYLSLAWRICLTLKKCYNP